MPGVEAAGALDVKAAATAASIASLLVFTVAPVAETRACRVVVRARPLRSPIGERAARLAAPLHLHAALTVHWRRAHPARSGRSHVHAVDQISGRAQQR